MNEEEKVEQKREQEKSTITQKDPQRNSEQKKASVIQSDDSDIESKCLVL